MAMDEMDLIKDEVFVFLDALRESGSINMFGAAPHVKDWFDVDTAQARFLVAEWMRTFSQRHTA